METTNVAEQYYLYRLDSAGTITWSYRFPSAADTYIGKIRELADGNVVSVGQTPMPGTFRSGGLITKISPTGQMVWQREYPRYNLTGINVLGGFSDFRQTLDKGFVITGGAIVDTGGGNYVQDFWIMKTDSFGCIGVDCGVTSVEEVATALNAIGKIYPNPATTELTVELNYGNIPKVKLYNIFGETVLASKITSGGKTVLDISMLPNCIYLYLISDVTGPLVTGKLVIMR